MEEEVLWCGGAFLVKSNPIFICDFLGIQGSVNQHGYHSIPHRSTIQFGLGLEGLSFVFQQDNDPKYTLRLCKVYFTKKESDGVLHEMTWPPQSPDLNQIELVWDVSDRGISFKSVGKAFQVKLVKRMPRVCKAVIQEKGGYLKNLKCKIYFHFFNTFFG